MIATDRIDLLSEAYEKLGEAIELILEAVNGTPMEAECDAYILGHLKNWKDGLNPRISDLEDILLAKREAMHSAMNHGMSTQLQRHHSVDAAVLDAVGNMVPHDLEVTGCLIARAVAPANQGSGSLKDFAVALMRAEAAYLMEAAEVEFAGGLIVSNA